MKVIQETPDSSSIKSYSYDIDTSELEVTFKSGVSYRYFEVDKETFANLQIAPSIGNFIATQIKKFEFEKVGGETKEYKPEIDLSNRARWPFPTGPKPTAEENFDNILEWTPEEEEAFMDKIVKKPKE